MDFIYSRVSTEGQTVDSQLAPLELKYPLADVIKEIGSGAKQRPKLDALVERLGPHDRLIVAALDRLGRSVVDVLGKVETLISKGVVLISDRENLDFSTSMGKMVMTVLLSVAELERGIISDRTKAGLQRATQGGIKLGRKANVDRLREVGKMVDQGVSLGKIGKALGMSKSMAAYYAQKWKAGERGAA